VPWSGLKWTGRVASGQSPGPDLTPRPGPSAGFGIADDDGHAAKLREIGARRAAEMERQQKDRNAAARTNPGGNPDAGGMAQVLGQVLGNQNDLVKTQGQSANKVANLTAFAASVQAEIRRLWDFNNGVTFRQHPAP